MKDFLERAVWTTEPVNSTTPDGGLLVEAAAGSDFWQRTHYGFMRDTGHALLAPLPAGAAPGAVEVTFRASFDRLYDQAGLMIRTSGSTWIKAGVEVSDGQLHVGAVVTREVSDWSLSPVPEWAGTDVTMRASWAGGAVTVRARSAHGPWRTIRLAPLSVGPSTRAGLYLCAPEREGLEVSFSRVAFGGPDAALHAQP
ncbi:DUF1349 domain-containing protein [Arthrobacter sp. Ld5]|uniref:DUF1349 domain-containing protein n=1 Tax=Arthrobacter sp. Ld5 TaxID=649152 RepID=UPI003EBC72AB